MDNSQILNAFIIACGITKRDAAVLLNLSETTLNRKLKGVARYGVFDHEIEAMRLIYDNQSLPYARFKNTVDLPMLHEVDMVDRLPLAQVIVFNYLQNN